MDKFTVTRFFRPLMDISVVFDHEAGREVILYSVSNLGGMTFFFDVTHTDDGLVLVKYSIAQCHATDNFNKKSGAEMAEAAFRDGKFVHMDNYNADVSLIENVWVDLNKKAQRKDPSFIQGKLYHVKNSMNKILATHTTVVELGEELDEIWEE